MPAVSEKRFCRFFDNLVFVAGLMHGRSVIILESLKRKFDWPRAHATNDFLGVAHPLNLRAKEMETL
jgi:hypothetical protein